MAFCRLSREREICCDEMAVAATGDRLVFTKALQWVVQGPATGTSPVLGAAWKGSKKMILERIRRLLGAENPRERFSWWPLGLAALVVPAMLMLSAIDLWPHSTARAEEPQVETSSLIVTTTETDHANAHTTGPHPSTSAAAPAHRRFSWNSACWNWTRRRSANRASI